MESSRSPERWAVRGAGQDAPTYRPGPSLGTATKYLSHATLFDGRVLLAGGQDPQNNPVFTAQVQPGFRSS